MKQNADRERQQNKVEVLIANPETPKLPKLLPIVLKVCVFERTAFTV